MANSNTKIWDEAKQDALSRVKNIKKQSKRAQRVSTFGGPFFIIKIIALLMTLYALAQYIPAFINFKKIVTQSSSQSGAQNLVENRKKWGAILPLRDYAKMNKAYMRAGQSLQVQYVLPENTKATLTIKQCKSVPFIEVFHCNVISENKIDISGDTVGTRRITLNSKAMYLLQSEVQVSSGEIFDIQWQRN